MNTERLMLRGALDEKKRERLRLATRAAGDITALKTIIQPAAVVPLAELRTAEALELARDLDETRTEFLRLSEEIREIERELA